MAHDRNESLCSVTAWLGLAIAALLCLSVLIINAAPLYYYDSLVGYYNQGTSILNSLFGLADTVASEGGAAGAAAADDQVSGNRSATYATLFAAAWRIGGPMAPTFVNFGAVLVATLLTARVVARSLPQPICPITLAAWPLAAAALTSLPFYIAYLMPDIYTALSLLMIALVVGFNRDMTVGELIVAIVIIIAGIISHRSTLAIVVVLLPVTAIASAVVAGRKWWIPTAMVALSLGVGLVELKGFERTADKVFEKTTVYSPFLTARMIADGPGYDYLQDNCPNADIATCKLAEALARSDDPWRLTASHILFETSERLGSYQLLTPNDQRLVAEAQREFVLDVFAAKPFGVIHAVLRNTLIQTRQVSVGMTIPTDSMKHTINAHSGGIVPTYGHLTEDRSWLDTVEAAHGTIYLLSLFVILAAIAVPGAMDRRHKTFALMLLIGVMANAFVCGAVSQPAARYGARVSWLLPYIAMMLSVLSVRTLLNRQSGPLMSK